MLRSAFSSCCKVGMTQFIVGWVSIWKISVASLKKSRTSTNSLIWKISGDCNNHSFLSYNSSAALISAVLTTIFFSIFSSEFHLVSLGLGMQTSRLYFKWLDRCENVTILWHFLRPQLRVAFEVASFRPSWTTGYSRWARQPDQFPFAMTWYWFSTRKACSWKMLVSKASFMLGALSETTWNGERFLFWNWYSHSSRILIALWGGFSSTTERQTFLKYVPESIKWAVEPKNDFWFGAVQQSTVTTGLQVHFALSRSKSQSILSEASEMFLILSIWNILKIRQQCACESTEPRLLNYCDRESTFSAKISCQWYFCCSLRVENTNFTVNHLVPVILSPAFQALCESCGIFSFLMFLQIAFGISTITISLHWRQNFITCSW